MSTAGAGLEGIVATTSSICFIDGEAGVLSYRGYNIHTLADHATFEEVIYLLWHGDLPTQGELEGLKAELKAERDLPPEVIAFLKSVPKATPMDVLRTAVSMLGLYDPKAADSTAEANRNKAVKLVSKIATIVTSFDRLRNGKEIVPSDPALSHAVFGRTVIDFDATRRLLDQFAQIHASAQG